MHLTVANVELEEPALRPVQKQDVRWRSMFASRCRHGDQTDDVRNLAFPALCRLNCRRSTPCRLRRHAHRCDSTDQPCSETARDQQLPAVKHNDGIKVLSPLFGAIEILIPNIFPSLDKM